MEQKTQQQQESRSQIGEKQLVGPIGERQIQVPDKEYYMTIKSLPVQHGKVILFPTHLRMTESKL